MTLLKLLFGYCLFLPFIAIYSFIVGPLLMLILIPSGVSLLLLILGYKNGVIKLVNAFSNPVQNVASTPFPQNLHMPYKQVNKIYKDAFCFKSSRHNMNAKQAYFAIFAYLPNWVSWLLKVRNRLVKVFGFSATNSAMASSFEDIEVGKPAGFLQYQYVSESEIVSFSEEPNMAIWLSVKKQDTELFTVSTMVELKTKRAQVYMAFIKPFHRFIAPFCIKSALSSGRI